MVDDGNYIGKISSFNEAGYRVARFDTLQKKIIEGILNLGKINIETGNQYHKDVFLLLITALNQSSGKMTPKELKKYEVLRKISLIYCDNLNLTTKKSINGLQKFDIQYEDKANLNKIRQLIFDMFDFLQEVMERTGFSSPNKEEEEGWD